MNLLEIASGPVIGAVIGYFTNYIAVKMLFLPRKPVRVFGKTLPFTPGIIPRRKYALARGMGDMIERELLTKDTLLEMLLTDEIKNSVALELTNLLTGDEYCLSCLFDPEWEPTRERAEAIVTDKLCEALQEFDLATPIATQGKTIIVEKFGALAGMLVTDELMAGIGKTAEERIFTYLREHREELCHLLHTQTDRLLFASPEELTGALGLTPEGLFPALRELYETLIRKGAPLLLQRVSVSGAVEARICSMEERAIEDMLLAVMKKELNAIVNLGAVIGFLLGLLNLLF